MEEINMSSGKRKILLALLPYWTPQIPPVGISCLKSFLQCHGFDVTVVDANVEKDSRSIYDRYFDVLRKYVSERKRGNFYNIGHDVLQNHMMAHLHYTDEAEYIELVKTLIFKTFYIEADDQLIDQLNRTVAEFYLWLEEYTQTLLSEEKPDVLGLSVYRGNLPASMFVFKLTREKHPYIKTVMGGAVFAQSLAPRSSNFNFFLEKTRDYIDTLIIGEGENLLLKLVRDQLPLHQRVFTIKDTGGETLDLSHMPIPDFSGLDLDFYPNLASYASRSCPFQCTFCTETVYWGKYRRKKAEKILGELIQLHNRYGRQLYLLCDSLLNPIISELADEFVNSGRVLYWDGYLRVDRHSCNRKRVLSWRRGGFYRARLGVESGSQKILDAMNKKITLDQVKTTIANLADAGIKVTTYWIIGYPGETEEDFQQTLDLVEELKDDIYEAECNPFGFYPDGQVKSEEWTSGNMILPVYPEKALDMLITQTWGLNCEPSREETYKRINRFVQHCTVLGIPNPYSLYDISQADERWKKLHKNAVPPLLEFKNTDVYIDESKNIKEFIAADNTMVDRMEFDF
jgi:radical SAM superfamily enzyme YgiQ (UPF0313 family)